MKTVLRYFLAAEILILVACAFSQVSKSQTVTDDKFNFKVRHYSVDDGLSQGSVFSMLRDSRGFLWMTSYEGLNRFDGRDFVVFHDIPSDSNSLSGSNTIGIVEDALGRIWIGSNKDINCFDPKTNKFTQPVESRSGDNFHYPFYADSTTVWFISAEEGVVIYNFLTGKREWSTARFKYHVNNYDINNVVRSQDGLIWIRDKNRIVKLIPGTDDFQIVFEAPTLYRDGELNSVFCLKLDLDGNILIGTLSNVYKYHIAEDTVNLLFSLSEDNGRIFDIEPHSDKMIWVGSNPGGVLLMDRDGRLVKQLNQNSRLNEKLPNNNVGFLFQDYESILWASVDPFGVSKIQQDLQPFESFGSFDLIGRKIKPNGIRCFEEDDKGNIVIGTGEAGVVYFDPSRGQLVYQIPDEKYPIEHASCLFYDSRGWLWIGSYQGLYLQKTFGGEVQDFMMSKLTGSTFSDVIWSIVEVDDKNIIISTDLGIYQISIPGYKVVQLPVLEQEVTGRMYLDELDNLIIPEHNNGFIVCPKISRQLNSLSDSIQYYHYFKNEFNIKSITYDIERNLYWLFTTTGLYSVYSDSAWRSAELVSHFFGYEDGLHSTYLYGGFVHGNSVWTGSNRGLHKINLDTRQIDVFDSRHGVQGLEYNTNAFFTSEGGKFYFGGVSGFESFYPEDIDHEVNVPPSPILLSLFVNNEEYYDSVVGEDMPLNFNYNENWIRFEFVSTNMKGAGGHTYHYRLQKNNTSWSVSYDGVVEYGLLSPGSYILEVKVKDDGSGLFSNSTSIPFKVLPPWWGTIWFKVVLFVLLIMSVWIGVGMRLKRIRKKEQRKKRLAELQLSALQSQMNPHFVFNCMTTIDGYIAKNERIMASRFVTAFSRLIRSSLELSRHSRISVLTELQFVEEYVKLELMRFEKDINFEVNLRYNNIATEPLIPPLTIQPIVENALRHGLPSRKDAKLLKVTDSVSEGYYRIHIFNEGKGMYEDRSTGMNTGDRRSLGMKIVQERFDLIAVEKDRRYQVIWENVCDVAGSVVGVKFTIFIPIMS